MNWIYYCYTGNTQPWLTIIAFFCLQCLNMSPEELEQRTVEFLDICYDEINLKYYKEDEVSCHFYLFIPKTLMK